MNTIDTNKYFLPAAVILAGLFIAGAVVWNGSHPASPIPGGAPTTVVDVKNVKTENDPFIGRADAPVTIAFWSDFQCPYCRAFEVGHPQIQDIQPALPEVVKQYVETGKVKVVFKDVVFLSPRMGMDSLTAMLYSLSVWKLYPERYFEWRTAMFTAQDEEAGGFGNAESIDKLNAGIDGLDAKSIAADVKSNTDIYTRHANENTEEAQRLGVNGTPAFIVGTQRLDGAISFQALKGAIDAELSR